MGFADGMRVIMGLIPENGETLEARQESSATFHIILKRIMKIIEMVRINLRRFRTRKQYIQEKFAELRGLHR